MYDYEDSMEARERNLMIIWRCPQCDFEYEDVPNCNENDLCPDCGVRCQRSGCSYDG